MWAREVSRLRLRRLEVQIGFSLGFKMQKGWFVGFRLYIRFQQ